MMDFRLKVFISVAQNLSFTKASKELYISQPAISKHIQELEAAYGVQLFERKGNAIKLTSAGEVFLKHALAITENYRMLQLDMNLLSNSFKGTLRIGASTTIAQYSLSPIIAGFISRFPDIKLSLQTGNSQYIEDALEKKRIDIGLVEGSSRKNEFRYTHFADDELVLVTSASNNSPAEITAAELKSLPLVLRETGSGTLDVIEHALDAHNMKLSQMNILLQLGSSESIKHFLMYSKAYAILSIISVSKELYENKLKVIDIKDIEFKREFTFMTLQGQHNEITDKFIQFALISQNKS